MDNLKNKRILFLANGLGMGNSTRCYSIIERLAANGVTVDVMTSGNGVIFFSNKQGKQIDQLIETRSLYYGKKEDGKLSMMQTMLSLWDFASIYIGKNRLVKNYLEEFNPSLVITDSEYIFLPMLFRKIPIIALNNADMVVSMFRKMRDKPISIYPQFFLVELWDFIFHYLVVDKVISPRLEMSTAQGDQFFKVPPIVREKCSNEIHAGKVEHVVIMLSGSAFGSNVNLEGESFPFHIDVIGRTGKDQPGVKFHGKVQDNLELINRAAIMAINAGFSAVSEGVIMKKPLVVIPVENHAEQYINAKMVEELGVGVIATAEEIPSAIRKVAANLDNHRLAYKELEYKENGAEEAAKFTLSRLGRL